MTEEACAILRQGYNTPAWLGSAGTAFLGAAVALLFGAIRGRWANGATARRLGVALWEELSAVAFAPGPPQTFGGFSSQVFDSLFGELARLLPEDLFREVVRYHWKMKYVIETTTAAVSQHGPAAGVPVWAGLAGHVAAAEKQWKGLLPRLDAYGKRSLARLFITRQERLLKRW